MDRRKFAKTIMGGLGASMLTNNAVYAVKTAPEPKFKVGNKLKTADGLSMTLSNHELPTQNKDEKQFVLTFDVSNSSRPLEAKIYHLTDQQGVKHQIYMTPVTENQMQAVFNWRTHD